VADARHQQGCEAGLASGFGRRLPHQESNADPLVALSRFWTQQDVLLKISNGNIVGPRIVGIICNSLSNLVPTQHTGGCLKNGLVASLTVQNPNAELHIQNSDSSKRGSHIMESAIKAKTEIILQQQICYSKNPTKAGKELRGILIG
jgi:hypothetical protein